MANAKIVCTLGPASDSREDIMGLARAGMSVARLNASHGTTDDRAALIENVRAVDRELEEPLAAMLDLRGPEIRTAPIEHTIRLEADTEIEFVEGETATPERVGLSVDVSGASVGDSILLDDGRIETTVTSVEGDVVRAHVEDGGELGGRTGVNLPGVDLGLDVVTERDREDLALAARTGIDFVAASFVRDAEDVHAVRSVLEGHGADIPIISKIERVDAVDNVEELIDVSYGIMVARGDLGVECPMEEVPVIQKQLIRQARDAGVPVITATEMLDSMITERRPTRAEASDVANAVLDGTDAVMLSAETAVGDHPIRVVNAMNRIISEIERSDEYAELLEQRVPTAGSSRTDAIARSSRFLARDVGASAVVVASESGYTALKAAKYRPGVPVVATTPNDRVRRQLALSWGVHPRFAPIDDADGANAVIQNAVDTALEASVAQSGDTVVVLSGMFSDLDGAGTTNMLKVHVAASRIGGGRAIVHGRVSGQLLRLTGPSVDEVPEGAIVLIDRDMPRLEGDLDRIGGVVSTMADPARTPAEAARTAGIPLLCGAHVDTAIADGETVTLDAYRGVLYEGAISEEREHDQARVTQSVAGAGR
jgi:pyruvate kinase